MLEHKSDRRGKAVMTYKRLGCSKLLCSEVMCLCREQGKAPDSWLQQCMHVDCHNMSQSWCTQEDLHPDKTAMYQQELKLV